MGEGVMQLLQARFRKILTFLTKLKDLDKNLERMHKLSTSGCRPLRRAHSHRHF